MKLRFDEEIQNYMQSLNDQGNKKIIKINNNNNNNKKKSGSKFVVVRRENKVIIDPNGKVENE